MAKKKINAANAFDKVWSETAEKIKTSIQEEQPEENTKKAGRPPKAEDEKLRGYRYNLNLDKDLKEYLHYIAWLNRTSITQYLNDLVRADMAEYIRNGGDESEWKKE